MNLRDIVAKFGKFSNNQPEELNAFVDEVLTAEELSEQDRRMVSSGYIMGMLTCLTYAKHQRPVSEAVSRMTQFLLVSDLEFGP